MKFIIIKALFLYGIIFENKVLSIQQNFENGQLYQQIGIELKNLLQKWINPKSMLLQKEGVRDVSIYERLKNFHDLVFQTDEYSQKLKNQWLLEMKQKNKIEPIEQLIKKKSLHELHKINQSIFQNENKSISYIANNLTQQQNQLLIEQQKFQLQLSNNYHASIEEIDLLGQEFGFEQKIFDKGKNNMGLRKLEQIRVEDNIQDIELGINFEHNDPKAVKFISKRGKKINNEVIEDILPKSLKEKPSLISGYKSGQEMRIQSTKKGFKIIKIFEKYPDPNKGCYNEGKLLKQEQIYYKFRKSDIKQAYDWIRIDKDSYDKLIYIKDNTNEIVWYDLTQEKVESQVCLCPNGFNGLNCEQPMFIQCFVNITDPQTYDQKQCAQKYKDDDSYMHSISGYAPCFFYNFSQKYTFKFKLDCKFLDSQGLTQIHPYHIGYKYIDVIKTTDFNKDRYDFSTNDDSKMNVLKNDQILVNIDFRDWKWISDYTRFQVNVNDSEILLGKKEGSIEIDFSQMEMLDKQNISRYEVAGRMYYEAHAFGYMIQSFTSSGFLDREGYKQPLLESTLLKFIHKNHVHISIIIAFVGTASLIIFYFAFQIISKSKKKDDEFLSLGNIKYKTD